MAQSAKEIFQRYGTHLHEPYLQNIRGTYQFEIENVGQWHVAVVDGDITVTERKQNDQQQDADCVIRSSEQDFIDIAEGRRNLLTAVLQGRVHISGDAALAQKVHGLVRANFEKRIEQQKEQRGAA